MNKEILLVAIGCGRVAGIMDTCRRQSFVVFGAMDDRGLLLFAGQDKHSIIDTPVYFYETG